MIFYTGDTWADATAESLMDHLEHKPDRNSQAAARMLALVMAMYHEERAPELLQHLRLAASGQFDEVMRRMRSSVN